MRAWATIAILGVTVRLALAAVSLGTNDAATFVRFAETIHEKGLLETYRTDPELNHPPIPAYWASIARQLGGDSDLLFAFTFKLPIIATDAASVWLIWRIWRRRTTAARAAAIAAGYAWSLDSILVSGFHCNTDPIYAMLCLAAIYLIEESSAWFWAGLALGAAINIKIIPVLLIVPLVLSMRNWRSLWLFVAGLAPGALPFLPLLYRIGPSFVRNALLYNSWMDHWGINYYLLLGQGDFNLHSATAPIAIFYYRYARYLIVALILGWAALARAYNRWSRYELAAVTFAIFLILTPGFGVQYTIMIGPLLFAIRPKLAIAYAWLAGVFLFCTYFVFWDGYFPIYANYHTLLSAPVAAIGILVWALVVAFLITELLKARHQRGMGVHDSAYKSGQT
ncbi:MAG TPA: glycosyltransferase family 87 protein [Bryobacteraceae bacterium]|nr:glycosyltransferase family 87 protein [Bryobacteraceae bacterium]